MLRPAEDVGHQTVTDWHALSTHPSVIFFVCGLMRRLIAAGYVYDKKAHFRRNLTRVIPPFDRVNVEAFEGKLDQMWDYVLGEAPFFGAPTLHLSETPPSLTFRGSPGVGSLTP